MRGIEVRNHLEPGTLSKFVGRTLPELLADNLWYGQALIPLTEGHALITTAFVSAVAGFLLLAEVLKDAIPSLAAYRLRSVYEQDLLGVPNDFVYPDTRDTTG